MYIKAGKIILEDKMLENVYLHISENGKFGMVSKTLPEGAADVLDYSSYVVAPGLVDTHIHGYGGQDVMDSDLNGLKAISAGLLSTGVTSFLPTTLTDSTEKLNAVCKLIGDHYTEVKGAKIQGVFLEGPFFTEEHKGAQNPKYMGDPSVEKLKKWIELSHGMVRKIAIAPEREGVTEFIEYANSQDVVTALAHTSATYDQTKSAVDAGASIFVHTFNGMRGIHHREPGVAGAALTLDNVYAEVIADGHHVHPAVINLIKRSRGSDETVLVTDCMRAGGFGEGGRSTLGEFEVVVQDGAVRLSSDGNLAGSILEMIDAVQNIVKWGIADLHTAINMASVNPAKSVGIDQTCGRIARGMDADFIVLDEEANLYETYVNGVSRYRK